MICELNLLTAASLIGTQNMQNAITKTAHVDIAEITNKSQL
jgi:hypothetical protein